MISQFTERAKKLGLYAPWVFPGPTGLPIRILSSAGSQTEKHADMIWLERNLDVRADPSKLLEGCQTIISLAYPYRTFAMKRRTATG